MIVDASDERQHTINFSLVSNTAVQPEELDEFHEARHLSGVGQLTKEQARRVKHNLDGAREYTLSSADIERIVRDKREKGLVKRSLAQQRADLALQLKAAQEQGDEDTEAKCAHL